MSALARHGLRWQPVVAYSTLWAASQTGDDHSPPSSNADYAAYAAALAARYGPGGAFWRANPGLSPQPVRTYEIWNEENLTSFWKPVPDPGGYADLYAAARAAIHAVDPNAVALVGGLNSGTDTPKFVEAMLAHRPDLTGHLDAVAIHPYAASADASLALVVRLRRGLQFLGSGDAPIAVTEVGWSTNTDAADQWRAGQLSQLTTDLARSDCGISSVQPHTWVTHDPQLNSEDGFALVHTDGTQTYSAVAYLAPAPSDPRPPAPAAPAAGDAAPPAAPATKRKAAPKCKPARAKRRGHHRSAPARSGRGASPRLARCGCAGRMRRRSAA